MSEAADRRADVDVDTDAEGATRSAKDVVGRSPGAARGPRAPRAEKETTKKKTDRDRQDRPGGGGGGGGI